MKWKKQEGGTVNTVETDGKLVRRRLSPWSPAIHKLLDHINSKKIDCVPYLVRVDQNFEYIEYKDGSPALRPWTKEIRANSWVESIGSWLKEYHQLMKDFELNSDEFAWGAKLKQNDMIPCHGDLGPWNILHNHGNIVAIIDWDLARWGKPIDDLTQMALENIPLRESIKDTMGKDIDRDILEKRLVALCSAYGSLTPQLVIENSLLYLDWLKTEVKNLSDEGIEPVVGFVKRGFLDTYDKDRKYISENWLGFTRE